MLSQQEFLEVVVQFVDAITAEAANTIFDSSQNDLNALINSTALKDFDISLLQNTHPDEGPAQFVSALTNDLLSVALHSNNNKEVTPWSLENAKFLKVYFQKLLGPVRKELPVIIRSSTSKIYEHNLTEEFAYGILITIKESSIRLYMKDTFDLYRNNTAPLTLTNLSTNYDLKLVNKRIFTATTSIGEVIFDTVDFIRGIITGARWLNINPGTIIRNIFRNGVLVTF